MSEQGSREQWYHVNVNSAGFIRDNDEEDEFTGFGWRAHEMPREIVFSNIWGMRSTVCKYHPIPSKTRILVTSEVVSAFGKYIEAPDYKMGRRHLYDVLDKYARSHILHDITSVRRSQREEEVRQRNISLAVWLYGLAGEMMQTKYESEPTRIFVDAQPGSDYLHFTMWQGPGWYTTNWVRDVADLECGADLINTEFDGISKNIGQVRCVGHDLTQVPDGVDTLFLSWRTIPDGIEAANLHRSV